jgi:hypothetical protein
MELDSRSIPAKGSGAEIDRIFRAPLPETGLADEALRAFSDVVQHSRAQNGRFFGYVLGSGETAGAAPEFEIGENGCVRISEPGYDSSWVDSFIYVDGAFRFIGRGACPFWEPCSRKEPFSAGQVVSPHM